MNQDSSLREVQPGPSAKQHASADREAPKALLGFQSGRELWLVNLADSGEIVPCSGITPVPLTQPWFAGLVNIRGTLYSVADFGCFQWSEPTPRNSDSRLLLIGARFGISAALLVSRTLGLRSLDQFEARPAESGERPWVGDVFADGRGHVWRQLKVSQLLTNPTFLDVGL